MATTVFAGLVGPVHAAEYSSTGLTVRVSVASDGSQLPDGNGGVSARAPVSPDGRYVAFSLNAGNIVPGDTNDARDGFIRDPLKKSTTRFTVANDGTQGNGDSYAGSFSADGRYVTFSSTASNLVRGDTNNMADGFIRDLVNNTTTRYTVGDKGAQGNGDSGAGTFSADARYVSFNSGATNLVPGDTNGFTDVFIRDRVTSATTRVSLADSGAQANGHTAGEISSGGRYVLLSSDASNLVPGDTNGSTDLFVRDRVTGDTTRVSVATDGSQANSAVFRGSISGDGRRVVFESKASNLVPNDTNDNFDIFVRDTVSNTTTRVSVLPDGSQTPRGLESYWPAISDDGRHVAFVSHEELVPEDTVGCRDVFVRDMVTNKTSKVNLAADGTQPDGGYCHSGTPSIDADGSHITFWSGANDLVPRDTNNKWDFFLRVRDVQPSTTSSCPSPTIVGTDKGETIRGTSERDVIDGRGGNDTIYGLDGEDLICAGPGTDAVYAGNGEDTVHGGPGDDRLNGGANSDRCFGGDGTDAATNCESTGSVP